MVRHRHRNSLDVEELLSPGQVVDLRIQLGRRPSRLVLPVLEGGDRPKLVGRRVECRQ